MSASVAREFLSSNTAQDGPPASVTGSDGGSPGRSFALKSGTADILRPLAAFVLLTSLTSMAVRSQTIKSPPKRQGTYAIAYASFAPLNFDLFVANQDGSNPRPFLPHTARDSNASFSADGKWIVFTSTRAGSADIYRARLDGTGLTRLTDHPAFDDQAALSPDNKHLVFVSSRSGQADLWLLDLASKKLTNLTNSQGGDFRPAWSPDGRWIAFSSDRDSAKPRAAGGFTTLHLTALYMIKPDGSGLRRLTEPSRFAGSPVWSRDGKKLLYYEGDGKEVNNIVTARRLRGVTQIVSVDLDNGQTSTLTTGSGEKWSPQFIFNEGMVGYSSGGPEGGIEFLDARGVASKGTRGEFRNPHWSPDGKLLVFHRDVDHNWPPFQPMYSPDPAFDIIRTGIFPSFSLDGQWMVTNDQPAAILHNKILLSRADGSGQSVMFGDSEKSVVAPALSPDGQWTAFGIGRFFQAFQGRVLADIGIVRRDGKGLRILTDGKANYGFPSWSPDGKQIVYRASGGENDGLHVINVETGASRPLLLGPHHDNFPSWSPRGDLISFTSKRDGDYELYTIRPDGTDIRRLTHMPGNEAHSAWSPDGKWIAFTSEREGFKDEAALTPHNGQPYGELCVMRADGTDIRQLIHDQFEDGTPAWIPPMRTKSGGRLEPK